MVKHLILLFFTLTFSVVSTASETVSIPPVVEKYEQAWKETNSLKRLALIETFWHAESIFEDPSASVIGAKGLNTHIDTFQKSNPGFYFKIFDVLETGDAISWQWSMHLPDGTQVLVGRDIAFISDKAIIKRLVGFFPVP